MSGSIDKLIISSPYSVPSEHWHYDRDTRSFSRKVGRRDAGYVVATKSSKSFDDPGVFVPIELVNQIRIRVDRWREAGYPGINVGTWFGILAPKKTPKEITNLLNREVVKIIRSPEFLKQMEDLGIDVVGNSPEEMESQIQEETERFRELVKVGKITVN